MNTVVDHTYDRIAVRKRSRCMSSGDWFAPGFYSIVKQESGLYWIKSLSGSTYLVRVDGERIRLDTVTVYRTEYEPRKKFRES